MQTLSAPLIRRWPRKVGLSFAKVAEFYVLARPENRKIEGHNPLESVDQRLLRTARGHGHSYPRSNPACDTGWRSSLADHFLLSNRRELRRIVVAEIEEHRVRVIRRCSDECANADLPRAGPVSLYGQAEKPRAPRCDLMRI